MKASKFKLPVHEKLLFMKKGEWKDARIDIIRKYYMELYGENPRETHLKENRMGRRSERRVFRKIDICVELFNRSLGQPKPNKRRCFWLQLEELTRQQKFYCENLVIMWALQGKVPLSWLRGIDLDAIPDEETEHKTESSAECIVVVDESSSQVEKNHESRPDAICN